MQTGTSASKRSVRALALAVAAGAAGLAGASVAEAAPFLTVSLWGRVQGSGNAFSATPWIVAAPGDTVEYEIRVELGAEDSVNPYAGPTSTSTTTTISNWVPSNGSTSPTSGLNQVRFHIVSDGGASFTSPATPAAGWADAPGNSPGTPAGDRLDGINLIRAAGNFAGIAPDGNPQVMTIASGVFDVVGFGFVRTSISGGGFTTTTVLATMRWRNDANSSNVNYNPTVLQQTNSTTGTAQGGNVVDPVIVYDPIPEPGPLGGIALTALAAGRRQRRRPNH